MQFVSKSGEWHRTAQCVHSRQLEKKRCMERKQMWTVNPRSREFRGTPHPSLSKGDRNHKHQRSCLISPICPPSQFNCVYTSRILQPSSEPRELQTDRWVWRDFCFYDFVFRVSEEISGVILFIPCRWNIQMYTCIRHSHKSRTWKTFNSFSHWTVQRYGTTIKFCH